MSKQSVSKYYRGHNKNDCIFIIKKVSENTAKVDPTKKNKTMIL